MQAEKKFMAGEWMFSGTKQGKNGPVLDEIYIQGGPQNHRIVGNLFIEKKVPCSTSLNSKKLIPMWGDCFVLPSPSNPVSRIL